MYRRFRDQILDILSTLAQGVSYVHNTGGGGALPVLADCRETLAAIAEALRGELTGELYARIEEALLRAAAALETLEEAARVDMPSLEAADGAEDALRSLSGALEEEALLRYQVVFLPYSASMWDSLESVWRAASGDPACDVSVVPLPYCERNPDGSAKSLLYDGGRLPSYVPVTPFQQYDLIERHPDIIYIHNVYDGGNRVTSVTPQYYTERLRLYTGMLVYIPYYIAGTNVAEHFYSLPGLANVDRIIAESEHEKRHFDQYQPKGKTLALGSPKIEKAAALDKYPPDIPEAWKRKMQGKTVVLYNTSIGQALAFQDGYLDKLEAVLDVFAARGDTVLLWRPHPLLKSTLQSMLPHLAPRYMSLERRFLREGRGIFDETPDCYAAIASSDAYLGDPSSLVDSYGVTGKPIMFQTMPVTRRTERGPLAAGIAAYGSAVYMTSDGFNALLRGDMDTGMADVLGEAEGERGAMLYEALVLHGGMLVGVPMRAESIMVYDIAKGSFARRPIPPPGMPYNTTGRFIAGVSYGRWVYLMGAYYPGVVRLDMETGQTDCLDGWLREDVVLSDNVRRKTVFSLFCNTYGINGDTLYCPFAMYGGVLELNMRTGHGRVRALDPRGEGYWGGCFDGAYLWLFEKSGGAYVRYKPGSWQRERFSYTNGASPVAYCGVQVHYCLFSEGLIWLFPFNCSGRYICVDTATGASFAARVECDTPSKSCYRSFAPCGSGLLAATYDNELLRMRFTHDGTLCVTSVTLAVRDSDAWDGIAARAQNERFEQVRDMGAAHAFPFFEYASLFSIPDFIDAIPYLTARRGVQAACYKEAYVNADDTCGQAIHRAIMEAVRGGGTASRGH